MRTEGDFRTILVKGSYGPVGEALASGSITPGMLVKRTNAAVDTVTVHATGGGAARKMFALEDDLQGKGITDAYADAANVRFVTALPGDEVLGILVSGQNVAKDAQLTSNGDGKLKAGNGTTDVVVGYARSAVNATGGDQRIVVEVA